MIPLGVPNCPRRRPRHAQGAAEAAGIAPCANAAPRSAAYSQPPQLFRWRWHVGRSQRWTTRSRRCARRVATVMSAGRTAYEPHGVLRIEPESAHLAHVIESQLESPRLDIPVHALGDNRPSAPGGVDPPGRLELPVRLGHRVRSETQLLGEPAYARQSLPRRPGPGFDVLDHVRPQFPRRLDRTLDVQHAVIVAPARATLDA